MRSLPSVWEVFLLVLCTTVRNVCVESSFEPKPSSVVNGRPRSEVDLETEKQLVLCAGQNKSLECLSPGSSISIQAAFWGRVSGTICPSEDGDPVTNCDNDPATLKIVKQLCDEKQECGVSAKHTVLQAPGTKHCPGVNKYMEVNYSCIPEMKKFVLCNGETTQLHCGQSWRINILSVYWGRDSPATCPTPLGRYSSCGSTANSLQALKTLCQGREQCSVRADDEHFSLRQDQPHCPAIDKYAVISFRCQPLTDDNLAPGPSQTIKSENKETNNSELAVTAPPKESIQPEQNQQQPALSQHLHDGTYNITVLPIPQYNRNTSAKLAPLFAYLNGDKTGKKESNGGPLPVPQDNHTTKATGETTKTTSSLVSASQLVSTVSKSGEDSSAVETEEAGLQKAPDNSQTLLSSNSSSGALDDKSMNKELEGDKTGAQLSTGNPPPAKAVAPGMISGEQSEDKELKTAQRPSEGSTSSGTNPTKLTPQGSTLATGKLDDVLQKQAKELCLSPRHNCPTAIQSPPPSDLLGDKVVPPRKQTLNSDGGGDTALEEKNKAHWSVMLDLAKQIQKTNNEAETVKTLNEKVHTLEVLSNALTTLTTKYFLEENGGNEDGSSREYSAKKVKAHRHHKPHKTPEIVNSKVNLLGSLLAAGKEEGKLLVPKNEENTAVSKMKGGNYLLPKVVDTLQNKINQAIEEAEASNRQSVSRHPLRHSAGEVTKDNNAHARQVSDKSTRREGAKDAENFNVIIKTLAKNAVGKGSANGQGGQTLGSIVRNVTLLEAKSLQDSGDSKGGRFDSLIGRDVRGPRDDAGKQVRNVTKGNTTMVLTAINTVTTPSQGITLGGRINTETPIKQAPKGMGVKLLRAMGVILNQNNKTVAKSAGCLAQGKSNCAGTSSNSTHLAQGDDLRNTETSRFKLKPGVQTTPVVGGQRKAGTEPGVKYTDVTKTLHPGKRLAVGSDKFKKNLKTMANLEEGIEKLITKLPNDHRQSDLPNSETLLGAPTDKESGENSPNKAVKLLQNIAVQLRKTVYLLDKTKAAKATRNREQQMVESIPMEQMPSDNSPMLDLHKSLQGRPFKTHVVRERLKTQNAWGTSSIPHVVEFHSGVTMGKIAGLGDSKVSDTSLKDASLLSDGKIASVPPFGHVLTDKVIEGSDHRLGNVNLGGAILSGVEKNLASSQPTAIPLLNQAIKSDKNGLLPVTQFSALANGSLVGLAENGTTQGETTQISVALTTEAGKGEQQTATPLAHSSTVKELVQGISNLVKLLSRNGTSEARTDENDYGEESDQMSESMPVAQSDHEYPNDQHVTPDMLATNQYDESEPEDENNASDDYTSNLNNHYVTQASNSVPDADSHLNSPNNFKIDEVGGHYTEYKDDYSDDVEYGNDAYENHVENDVTGGDTHSNWDDDYGHAQRHRNLRLSNRTGLSVDPLTDYNPTKKSPLVEEYDSLPSPIRDLDDPRLKDNRVLDYIEGMIDKGNADETNQLMNLRPKMLKGSTARKSKISYGRLAAVVAAATPERKRREEKSYQ